MKKQEVHNVPNFVRLFMAVTLYALYYYSGKWPYLILAVIAAILWILGLLGKYIDDLLDHRKEGEAV